VHPRAGRSAYGRDVPNQALGNSPLVLEQQNAPKLREPVRAALERAQDRLPVVNRECHDIPSAHVSVLEPFGCIGDPFQAKALGKLEHETIRDRESCEKQRCSILRLCGSHCHHAVVGDAPVRRAACRRPASPLRGWSTRQHSMSAHAT
jgi:hypothetical protein